MKSEIRESYWQQDISRKQRLWMISKSMGVTVLTAWLYYRSLWAMCILWPMFLWYYRNLKVDNIQKRKAEFLLQFKEMIQSMASSLNAGYSVENAIRQTQKELLIMYPENERICIEMKQMVQQVYIHIPVEQIFEEFAKRVGLEDVRNFSNIFSTAKRSGGDMIAIIKNTTKQIGDKIDVKREIDTILASKQYEFRVMSAIPYIMIGYMTISFPEFMTCLYYNLAGIGVMSLCLCIYLGAYALGVKLVKIEV
ncbi:MAG: type II secretion system F family protein [Lachnospiraceae bacterium]